MLNVRALLIAALLFAGGLPAATFTVSNANDSGTGSFRQAVFDANLAATGDTIVFDTTGVFATPQTITLLTALPQITSAGGALTITGTGVANVALAGPGATGNFRLFDVGAGATVTITGMTLRDGRIVGASGFPAGSGMGGAILNAGTLTLSDCNIINCIARGGDSTSGPLPGGQGAGGAINNTGVLTLNNVRIEDCLAVGGNATSFPGGGGEGGAIIHSNPGATLAMTGCSIINCIAQAGSGIGTGFSVGGAMELLCPATITDCTIDGCSVAPAASVGFGAGGIYFNASAAGTTTMTGTTISNCTGLGLLFGNSAANTYNITNCTISGNANATSPTAAANGCGAHVDAFNSTVNFVYCTISNNNGYEVGGVRQNSGTVTLRNCIVAENISANAATPDAVGTFTDLGFNLIGDNTGSTGFTVSTQVGTGATPIDPGLLVLGSYGGPTQTMPPGAGSAAIDGGGLSAGVTNDQRGQPRINDIASVANAAGGNGSDIGAFEQSDGVLVSGGPLNFGATLVGTPSAEQTIAVQGSGLTADIVVTPPADFEISLTSGSGFAATALMLAQTGGGVAVTTIYVRYNPAAPGADNANLTVASIGFPTQNVAASGSATFPPTITLSAALPPFSTAAIATPSAEQSYTVSGVSLSGPVTLRVTAPFEMSLTSGGPYSAAPIVLTPSAGTLAATPIFVRYNPASGTLHAGIVTHESAGVPTVFQPMVGVVGSLGGGGGGDDSSCTTGESAAPFALLLAAGIYLIVPRRKRARAC